MPTANTILIPSYDMLGLPILPWIAQVLMALTLALHWSFLAMTAGGAVAYIANRYNGSDSDTVVLKGLSAFLPFSLSMAMTLGIAPLLFVQVLYGNFFYTANILMGYVWLGLLVLTIVNFYLLYLGFWLSKHQRSVRCVGILILLLLAGSALILSANATLTQSPQVWEAFRAYKGIAPYLGDTTLLPRWTFAIFALLGGGGLFVSIYSLLQCDTENETHDRTISRTVLISIIGMAGIVICGFWASRSLPEAIRSSLFSSGESVFAYAAAASFVLAFVLTLSSWFKKSVLKLGLSAVLFFLGLLATAALRDTLRRISLGKQLSLTEITVHSQWGSFVLFVVIFILGLALISYIVKQSFFYKPKLRTVR